MSNTTNQPGEALEAQLTNERPTLLLRIGLR